VSSTCFEHRSVHLQEEHVEGTVKNERNVCNLGGRTTERVKWPTKKCVRSTTVGIGFNTFAASYLNTQGLNNSCLKSPAATLVDLNFQSRALRSFSLNQLRNLSL